MEQNNIARSSLNSDSVKVLWTGGWDSTFHLLNLLIARKMTVSPFYLIDEDRPSIGVELLTMKRIKAYLQVHFPDAFNLMNAIQYFSINDLASDQHITETYTRVREKFLIGIQYDWLARFCEQHGLDNLQLCIHKDDRAYAVINTKVEKLSDNGFITYKLPEELAGTEEWSLFKYYSFPILDLTKREMAERARKQGWQDVMKMTWFCHRPKKGTPCGTCNPCLYTIEEGLGWRIPSHRRILSRLNRTTLKPTKKLLKKMLHDRFH